MSTAGPATAGFVKLALKAHSLNTARVSYFGSRVPSADLPGKPLLRLALFAGMALAVSSASVAAQEMRPPRITTVRADWPAAIASLSDPDALKPVFVRARYRNARRPIPPVLSRLNAVMVQRLPGLASSPVPVLLPFDTVALMRDQAAGTAAADNDRYLAGFSARTFFFPGPSGYDAALAIRTADIAELSDITFPDPISVQISGSALLYELDEASAVEGAPVPELEAAFPGIRRMILEHNLRYTFVRFGVPYVVSVTCFDAGRARFKMPTCRDADRVARRFLGALRIVGGTPQVRRPADPLPIERPAVQSPVFSFHPPGRILTGTGFRGQGGRSDNTVYAQIRFPIGETPAFANSQMFQKRNPTSNYGFPWRDNFCERRGFPVSQCPAGIGHQGQDIRAMPCQPGPGENRCVPHNPVVAVRDGAILRAPKQEAVYLVVNTATERIRFRYLHMRPIKMDSDNLLSGRLVNEGEVIGEISNFDKHEAGTSYHLHFDVQVPTRHGWVFVNPYMTLVSAYERLIGARGEQINDPTQLANADPSSTAAIGTTRSDVEPQIVRHKRAGKRAAHKTRKHKRYARR